MRVVVPDMAKFQPASGFCYWAFGGFAQQGVAWGVSGVFLPPWERSVMSQSKCRCGSWRAACCVWYSGWSLDESKFQSLFAAALQWLLTHVLLSQARVGHSGGLVFARPPCSRVFEPVRQRIFSRVAKGEQRAVFVNWVAGPD